MALLLETDTAANGLDITSAALAGSYTPGVDRWVGVTGRLKNLNGAAATLTFAARLYDGSAEVQGIRYSDAKPTAANTAHAFTFSPIFIPSGYTLRIYATSTNASDTSAGYDIWFVDAAASDVYRWNGTDVATPDTAGYPKVTIKDGTGQGELNLAGGVVDANIVQANGSAFVPLTEPVDANVIQISGDSDAADNLEAAADGSGYNLGGGQIVVASVAGDVGGNLNGNVGGFVTGSVGSVFGDVGGNVNGNILGDVFGDVQKKVLGGGASDISGIGASASVASIATDAISAASVSAGAVTKIMASFTAWIAGITSLAAWLRAAFRSSTPDSTALTEINNGGGTFDSTMDSLENLYNVRSSVTVSQAAALAAQSGVASGFITLRRGDTISISIAGLGSLVGRSKLWFTAKSGSDAADSASLIQIEETAGLVYLAGVAGTAGQGSITVTDATAGDITVSLVPAASGSLTLTNFRYDVQMKSGSTISTMGVGEGIVVPDTTRATS